MNTLRPFSFRARLLPALVAAAAVLFAFAPAASAQQTYVLVPRDGTGIGTLSAYGGVTTVFSADAAGADGIDIPDTGKTEVNLIWTFWRHTQPASDAWPVGQRARSTFTLKSGADTSLTLRIGLRVAGEWTELIPAPELALSPGKPAVVSLPLPPSLPVGAVEVVRVQITSHSPIPALRVTDWTVAEQK